MINIMNDTYKNGFTIVELLVVIVVIAILAAISIVSYTGIQNRATETQVIASVKQASGKILQYQAIHGLYPAALEDAGVQDDTNASYDFRSSNVPGSLSWCLTATNKNISFYTSNISNAPVKGSCPAPTRVWVTKGAPLSAATCGGATPCHYVTLNTQAFTAGQYQVRCLRNGQPASSYVLVNVQQAGSVQLNCFVGGAGVSVGVQLQSWGTSETAIW